MSKVLKIYEGNVDTDYKGSGDLLYSISGDLLSVNYTDLSNYEIDLFDATIAKGNYDIDINDVWRLYDRKGNLLGSGPIESEPITDTNGNLKIQGTGWTGILTRRTVDNKTYTSQNGAAIFNALLTAYFSDYNINTDAVVAPQNNLTNTYDKQSVYDIMRDISSQSYGTNSRQFDFYLYEATAGTIKAVFFERGSGTAVTILPGDIHPTGFNLSKRGDLDYNYVVVEGTYGDMVYTPSDTDWWTEEAPDSIWGSSGFSTGLTAGTYKVGNSSIFANSQADANDVYFSINLDHADAYDETYTLNNFTEDIGYLNNGSRRQYLHFYLLAERVMDVELGWDAGSGTLKKTNFVVRGDTGSGGGLDWTEMNINLYDLHGEDWVNIAEIMWKFPKVLSSDDMRLDGLYFYDVIRFKGNSSDEDGSPGTPQKDFYFLDEGLKSNAECEKIAEYLFQEFNATTYEGTIRLSTNNHSIRAGSIVNIKYPQRGIDLSSIPVQKVVWSNNNQILYVGRHRSLSEILSNTRGKIDRGI